MKPRRRRLPLRHVVTAVAVGAIVAVVMAVPPGDEAGRRNAATPSPATPAALPPAPLAGEAPPTGNPDSANPAEPSAVRRVSGPGITPPPEATEPPRRTAPPERPTPPPPPVLPRRLGLVKMEDTANFSVGDIRVRLPGVAVTGPEETCRDRAGVEWPCGRRALAGVRAVVRGKTVECPLPDKVRRGDFVTDCRLAGADMAERLVASGWARALDRDGALGEAERAAEAKAVGLHGAAVPIGVDLLPDPGDLPADPSTAPLTPPPDRPTPAARPALPSEAGR